MLNTQSGISQRRKTLNALVNASELEFDRQSQSHVNFTDHKWKIYTSKILDNNKLGIGSVLQSPTNGLNNERSPKELFKPKLSVEEAETRANDQSAIYFTSLYSGKPGGGKTSNISWTGNQSSDVSKRGLEGYHANDQLRDQNVNKLSEVVITPMDKLPSIRTSRIIYKDTSSRFHE